MHHITETSHLFFCNVFWGGIKTVLQETCFVGQWTNAFPFYFICLEAFDLFLWSNYRPVLCDHYFGRYVDELLWNLQIWNETAPKSKEQPKHVTVIWCSCDDLGAWWGLWCYILQVWQKVTCKCSYRVYEQERLYQSRIMEWCHDWGNHQ